MEKFDALLMDLYGMDVGFEPSHADPPWLTEDGLPCLEELDPYPTEVLFNRVASRGWFDARDNGLRGMLKAGRDLLSSAGEEVSEALLTSCGSRAFSSPNMFGFIKDSESWESWESSGCSDESEETDDCGLDLSAIPNPSHGRTELQ